MLLVACMCLDVILGQLLTQADSDETHGTPDCVPGTLWRGREGKLFKALKDTLSFASCFQSGADF